MMYEGADDALGVLDRMTKILQAFDAEDHGLGLSELARQSGLPKSTVSRLAASLVRHGYLERDGRLLHLGIRVFELGELAREPRELRAVALPLLLQLRDETGKNIHLAIRDGGEMVCVAILRGRDSAPPAARVGERLPARTISVGEVAVSHTTPPEMACATSSFIAPGGTPAGTISISGCADCFDAAEIAALLRTAARAMTRRLATLAMSSS